jgi:polyphosphate kinase
LQVEVDADHAEYEHEDEFQLARESRAQWTTLPSLSRYLDRELSWLDFNERVLALAESPRLPLLERARFLAIFSRNLDEFFQIRVGGLKMQVEAGLGLIAEGGEPAGTRLERIAECVRELVGRQNEIFEEQLAPELSSVGIHLSSLASLDEHDRAVLDRTLEERIFPILTPLAVDPAHPFPYISNLSLNLAVVVRVPGELTRRIARLKVPPILPRFVVAAGGQRFVPVEQVIASRLWALFPGMEVLECHPFRVTRNADYEVDLEDTVDLRTAVQSLLLQRRRSQIVVRLEVEDDISDEVLGLLTKELRIDERDVHRVPGLLDLGGLWTIAGLDRPDLKFEPWTPVSPIRLTSAKTPDLLEAIRDHDVLVHHPYDSFETSVEAFIEQAASDPTVLAIKQTLYRTSGAESRLMESLIRAASLGKQVVCVVELKARFDEEANIGWAQKLEEAGVHVVYGVVGLKTHAKLCLIVREEDGAIRRYAHVGTGNYNPDTAHVYEDLGLFTADPEITMDVSDLFNLLTGYSRQRDFRRLLVAPAGIRPGLVGLIEQEAREGGRIVIKVNNLVDHEIIDALYEASQAGAQIHLIVRGACCLRPGVTGLSERIRVRSVVGRYLEHSRIYRFGEDAYYIGSADVMDRNLDRRVESLVPISAPGLRARIDDVLEVLLADDVLAWELQEDGTWRPPAGGEVDTHRTLERHALDRTPRLTLA